MEYTKPLPFPDPDTKPYWEWTKRHELRMQHCADCGEVRFPPRPMCPACNSMRDEWVATSGIGTIYSWVVIHPPVLPAFADDAPYAVVLVQLDDDPSLRLVGTVSDVPIADLAAGIPVEVWFDDVTDEVTLPRWRRRV
ncbi:MAG: OB-fold domain-containing protein [bacterium]